MGRLQVSLLYLTLAHLVTSQTKYLDEHLFKRIELFEQYAAASYCSVNNNGQSRIIACAVGNCPLVEQAKPMNVMGLSKSPDTDVNGFIAHDDVNKATVISFRGSESIKNWRADIDLTNVKIDMCAGCTATRGFWRSWNESRVAVLAAVNETVRESPKHRIVAVGHSLGAAIATLAASELRHMGHVVDLYTFGSPRIGNPTFARHVEAQAPKLGINYRITHYNDPVPNVPLISMGFSHVGPEFYITTANKLPVEITSVTVFNETDGNKGNGQWFRWDADAHTWYFNAISECYQDAGPGGFLGILDSMGFSMPAMGMFGGSSSSNGSKPPTPSTPTNATASKAPSKDGKPPSSGLGSSLTSIYESAASFLGISKESKNPASPAKVEPWLQGAMDQLDSFKQEHGSQPHPDGSGPRSTSSASSRGKKSPKMVLMRRERTIKDKGSKVQVKRASWT